MVVSTIHGADFPDAPGNPSSEIAPGSGPDERESPAQATDPVFLPKTHRILERRFMEFRPFGKDPSGTTIRDMSGVSIRSNVEYLEESVARTRGVEAGKHIVEELVNLLNGRIPDRAYHITSKFLRNPWTSYSNEFTAYLVEFCLDLSGDPNFQFNMGREKLIPPIIQTLMRPFSVAAIYRTAARWASHYAKSSYFLEGLDVTDGRAVLRMTLMEQALRQFGPYRRACARIWCNALAVGIAVVPEKIHHLGLGTITHRQCIAEGGDCCEWEVRWAEPAPWYPGRRLATGLARQVLRKEISEREMVIVEQMSSLETRHEELQKAYMEVQQTAVELQRRVDHLTTLHEAGLTFTSTRDREVLLQHASETLIQKLYYDRVMIAFYNPLLQVLHGARLLGVSPEIAAFAEQIEVPVTDPTSIEGTVLLQGQPVMVNDLSQILDRIHPLYRKLASQTGTNSFLSVPLKVGNWILGSLTVNRSQAHVFTQDDLGVVVTFANQLAVALDNVAAYREIEAFNIGLEQKVLERTAQLEAANKQLKEMDRLKSSFVSVASHELRTPMTSIKGYVENMLEGLTGVLTDKQTHYLIRIKCNVERLTRMISDLLDLSRIEAGRVELRLGPVPINELVNDVADNLQPLARDKSLALEVLHTSIIPVIQADRDRQTQILTNLIGNAIKFTPPGGTIQVKTQTMDDRFLQISVADTGCGIGPDELPKVVDKFYRAEGTPTEAHGAGLGLAIVKSLVEIHGGRIWAESTPGKGSCFSFTIPLTQTIE